MNYTPISFKTDYSLLKSMIKINDIIEYAVKNKSKHVGVLDDNPYGIMDFYDKCEKKNLKCIFGMILKINDTKIYIYITNYNGYLNLIKINDLKNDNKFTLDDLFKYNEGLIIVLPYGNYNLFNRFKTVFNTYLGYKNKSELESALMFSKNVLFINEILCFNREDVNVLKILYKINSEEYDGTYNYILDASDYDKSTILEFTKEFDLKFDYTNRYIPVFTKSIDESKKMLRSLSILGLTKRCNGNVTKVYADRLKYELNVIDSMGFTDYFLIVYDYVKYARKHDIIANPRGSAAGSLVAYSLGITETDPIKYDLLFERFLNPERVTMPDIDVDFEDIKRGEVIEYVRKKYGEKKVALIVAYGTLGSKQVIRDVGKVLEVDVSVIDSLSKKIDAKKSLRDNLKDNSLVDFIKENKLEQMYKISMKLEGIKRHTTLHAAGVIISSVNLINIVPTIKTNDGLLTGFTMEYLERLGLLKMDFLALRNLTTMHNIMNLIKAKNPNFDIKKIPLNDTKTYELFKKADTDNVFQFESAGMKNFLKKLSPSKFDDLVAANALFRPGPMQNIPEYIERRHGRKNITYLHKDLEPILKSTYGIIIYQEQIMQILSLMGGYSFAEADLIRRAMSKKKHDVMENEKIKFTERAVKKGYRKDVATAVYDLIVKFADYGFNKSHSVAYAQIGYQMAYMKANYKDFFQVNTLNMNIGGHMQAKDVIEDAKERNITIIKPDINKSRSEYVIENNTLILPLTMIKDINSTVSNTIISNAPYTDLFDLIIKTYNKGLNRRVVETLINAGACDSLGETKNTLLSNIDSAITYLELISKLDASLITKPEITKSDKVDDEVNELEVFGFYIMGHPANKIDVKYITKIKYAKNMMGKNVIVGVLVEKLKVINTKKGEKMAFLTLSDETGKIDAVIFPKNNNLLDDIHEDVLIVFIGNIQNRNDEVQLVINDIKKKIKRG